MGWVRAMLAGVDAAADHRDDRYDQFPTWFFERSDPAPDSRFYAVPRLVTHIDVGAIAAVGAIYDELIPTRDVHVLDLMSSWISHFRTAPDRLTVLGMRGDELDANEAATERVVHDLNATPSLPFDDATFDAAVCCVSVDYLTRPIEVFDEVARVLRPGAVFVCTFSNRCFPTKAIAGWLQTDDAVHVEIVDRYFRLARGFGEPEWRQCATPRGSDPLFAVWARRVDARG